MDYYKKNLMFLEEHQKRMVLTLSNAENRRITIDGPVSIEYNNAPIKILWILKEPHGEGGGSLIEFLNRLAEAEKPADVYNKWHSTYSLVIKVSYGLFSQSKELNVPAPQHKHYRECLMKIAVINLNKFGGGVQKSAHYYQGLKQCKDLIKWQVEHIAPEVVILGNTFHDYLSYNFATDGMILPEHYSPSRTNFPSATDRKGRIYVSAYHPGVRGIMTHRLYYELVSREIRSHKQW